MYFYALEEECIARMRLRILDKSMASFRDHSEYAELASFSH